MSGPKVVRIVTREEIEAICRGHLRDVETAIASVTQVATRLERLDGTVADELARQRQTLAALFQAENWMEVQKRAPAIVASLQAYTDRIRAEAVAAAAAERAKGRRLAEGARTLIAALEKAGQSVSPALRAAVRDAVTADPDALAAIETELNGAMRQLASVTAPPDQATPAARAMAERLGAGLEGQSLGAWLTRAPLPDPRDARLDAVLAELRVVADAGTLLAFERRAGAIAEQAGDQRALLTDSLILEASRLAAQRRAAEQMGFRLQQARAALAPLADDAGAALVARIDAALASSDTSASDALCAEATAHVEQATAAFAAQARREAVLSGLSALGYEIRGGMATAWASDGRIVVRKPGTQDYGVELGAPGDAARLQVRLVGSDRPSTARTAERDRDQEVGWCSEFEALQARVAAAGGHLVIERAVGVGVQPVKTVAFADAMPAAEAVEIRQGARTLR